MGELQAAGKFIWENRENAVKAVRSVNQYIRRWLKGPTPGIIVMGAGGCGKKGDEAGFLGRWLAEKRAEEVRILDQLSAHIASNPKPMWLLTLVAKQGLWHDEESSARDFYLGKGAYARKLKELMSGKDAKLFRSEVAFGPLTIRNFDTGKGERLKSNVAGYDHKLQAQSLRALFETVAQLKDWEAK